MLDCRSEGPRKIRSRSELMFGVAHGLRSTMLRARIHWSHCRPRAPRALGFVAETAADVALPSAPLKLRFELANALLGAKALELGRRRQKILALRVPAQAKQRSALVVRNDDPGRG